MNDNTKIKELNSRCEELESKFYKIHSLALALVEYENSPKKDDNKVSNVSENIAELISEIAKEGVNVVSARTIIS